MHDETTTVYFPELAVPSYEDTFDLYLALISAVHSLDKKDMFIVALISAGYTRIEGGRIVGITRNAVGKRYAKAVQKLYTLLQEDYTEV